MPSKQQNTIDQVEEQCKGGTLGMKYKAMGFRPKHPVALFNSLSGNVIEVVESERMPHWVAKQPDGKDGGALWVDIGKVTAAAVGNITGVSHSNTKAARIQKWQDELIHMMDTDGDGSVDTTELLAFLADTATLKNDKLVQKVRQEAEGKTTIQLLKELGPIMPKILAALVAAKSTAEIEEQEDAILVEERGDGTTIRSSSTRRRSESARDVTYNWEASTEYAKHMQLVGGWRDPDGIKVRPRSGLAAMECLVANDPGGLAAKFGAACMLPVTSALRDVGYIEGVNMRAYGYDWRTPCTKLEERDQWLSKTMEDITELVATNRGQKAVVITHSLGGVMASYFFHWVAHSPIAKQHGGGVKWLEENIHCFCPIGGPLLGTPFGSHSYLTGDEGQGLAPAVFSYADRHLVVRSWGMFGMIFPTGRHLMLQPTKSVHWVRKQGCLNVHVMSVHMKGEEVDEDSKLQFYVKVGLREPWKDYDGKHLKCKPIKMSSTGAIDERMQFYCDLSPQSIEGGVLTVSLWRDWVGPIDKEVARGTFDLSTHDITIAEGVDKGGKLAGLKNNEYVQYVLPLKEETGRGLEVTCEVRMKFVPFNDQDMHLDFRRPDDEDPGAYRCGGKADACTSPEKQDRLLQALGEEQGTEWQPKFKKPENARNVTYAPMSIDQMMVLDDMHENYVGWKECYGDDPVWRQYSTEPPEGVKRIRPIYGINVPTLCGNVYRRVNKKIKKFRPNTSLELDTECVVTHPGFEYSKGIVSEMPHTTHQADDPTVPLSDMTFKTKASGDGTVAYWSLRWPITWKNLGYDVKNIEVEGAGHRDILEKTECLETCLFEACSTPTKYIEVTLHSVSYVPRQTCKGWCFAICCCPLNCLCKCLGLNRDCVFVELSWHGVKFTSETLVSNWTGGRRDIEQQCRFVLGVTEDDFEEDTAIELSVHTAIQSDISKGPLSHATNVVPQNICELAKKTKCDKPQKVNVGSTSSSRNYIMWSWRWGSADDAGKPNFSAED